MARLHRTWNCVALAGLLAGTGGCCATKECRDQPECATRVTDRNAVPVDGAMALMAGPGNFHPVPTRPVFGPRPEMLPVPVGAPPEAGPGIAPEPEDIPGAAGEGGPDDPRAVGPPPRNSARQSAPRTIRPPTSTLQQPRWASGAARRGDAPAWLR